MGWGRASELRWKIGVVMDMLIGLFAMLVREGCWKGKICWLGLYESSLLGGRILDSMNGLGNSCRMMMMRWEI